MEAIKSQKNYKNSSPLGPTALTWGLSKYLTAQDTHFSPTPSKHNRNMSSHASYCHSNLDPQYKYIIVFLSSAILILFFFIKMLGTNKFSVFPNYLEVETLRALASLWKLSCTWEQIFAWETNLTRPRQSVPNSGRPEKVLRRSWESPVKSPEKALWKFWESLEKFLRKS